MIAPEHDRVIFTTETLLDLNCITLFGVSVKLGDNPIGKFGTGLKYALAVLLRDGHEVLINIGMKSHYFTIKDASIRGEPFSVVHMNGEPLSFTTHLGAHWELWMAFRELYSNTQDEAGDVYSADSTPNKQEGWTTVTVFGRDFVDVLDNKGEVFLSTLSLLESSSELAVSRGSSPFVYNKGIRIAELDRPTVHTYNMLEDVTLTEDRNLKSEQELRNALSAHIMQSTSKDYIREALTAGPDSYEYELYFNNYLSHSEEFAEVVGEIAGKRRADLPPALIAWWDAYRSREASKRAREGTAELDITAQVPKGLSRTTLEAELLGHLTLLGLEDISITLIEE